MQNEWIKFYVSNFKSPYLSHFCMDLNETKLSMFSDEGSTTSIQLFHELRNSSSNLQEATELEQVISSLEKSKQLILSSWMNEWMKVWRLSLHDLSRIVNCNWWMYDSICFKSWWNLMDLASKMLNYACGWWISQEQGNAFEENSEKCESKICENL